MTPGSPARGGGDAPWALEGADGDRIVVHGDRIAPPRTRCERVVRIPGTRIRPGLVNAHDHLTLNHYPRLGTPPYPSVYAWAEDVHERFADQVAACRRLPREDALLFGALKNLLGGVTRVIHHDPWSFDLERLPVRVERVRVLHSLGLVPEGGRTDLVPADGGLPPLCMHLAEGVDEVAAAEVAEADRRGLVGPDLLAVHLLGASEDDARRLREAGVGFVWCPGSSAHLYGRAVSRPVIEAGLDLLIGTDSLLSGEGTLLHELALARATGLVDDPTLAAAVGATVTRRLGLPEPSLDPGRPADLVALRRPVLEARPEDVALVLVGGLPRYGDAALAQLFRNAGVEAESIAVGGVEKLVAAPMGEVCRRVLALSPTCGRILA